jgi:Tuberculosis necrotizing toxin
VLEAWRSAERTALAVLGFDCVGTDRYECRLDADDWVGGVSLPKRSQGPVGRGGVVALDPFVLSLGHVPTERIDKPRMAEDAAALTARVIEDWVLPWMRANADLGRLARRLASHDSFGSQARQLERLATVSYQLGDRDAATAALREYRARCCDTGILAIDGPSERFVLGLHERLHGPARPAGSGSGLRRAEPPTRQLTLHQEQWARGQTAATLQAAMPSIQFATRSPAAPAPLLVLGEGLLLDHLGQESGSYLYPDGTPFQQRSLPPSVLVTLDPRYPNNYHRYQVVRSFTVHGGIVAPAFQQPGGAVQLKVESALLAERPMLATVLWLLRNGYLRRVTPA